jgi:hypothetical protein
MKLEMYALYKMIYECCGEDQDVLENAKITEIGPNAYHVEHKITNQFEGVALDVAINITEDPMSHTRTAHYAITNSVYGDDGEFDIEL